jgi:translation initiation factor IF-2
MPMRTAPVAQLAPRPAPCRGAVALPPVMPLRGGGGGTGGSVGAGGWRGAQAAERPQAAAERRPAPRRAPPDRGPARGAATSRRSRVAPLHLPPPPAPLPHLLRLARPRGSLPGGPRRAPTAPFAPPARATASPMRCGIARGAARRGAAPSPGGRAGVRAAPPACLRPRRAQPPPAPPVPCSTLGARPCASLPPLRPPAAARRAPPAPRPGAPAPRAAAPAVSDGPSEQALLQRIADKEAELATMFERRPLPKVRRGPQARAQRSLLMGGTPRPGRSPSWPRRPPHRSRRAAPDPPGPAAAMPSPNTPVPNLLPQTQAAEVAALRKEITDLKAALPAGAAGGAPRSAAPLRPADKELADRVLAEVRRRSGRRGQAAGRGGAGRGGAGRDRRQLEGGRPGRARQPRGPPGAQSPPRRTGGAPAAPPSPPSPEPVPTPR